MGALAPPLVRKTFAGLRCLPRCGEAVTTRLQPGVRASVRSSHGAVIAEGGIDYMVIRVDLERSSEPRIVLLSWRQLRQFVSLDHAPEVMEGQTSVAVIKKTLRNTHKKT